MKPRVSLLFLILAAVSSQALAAGPISSGGVPHQSENKPELNVNEALFAFLAGPASPGGGGGGLFVRKSDVITCVDKTSAIPGGIVHVETSCFNSASAQVTGTLAIEFMKKIDASDHVSEEGGVVVVVRKGRVECAQSQMAAPGGPVVSEYSCR